MTKQIETSAARALSLTRPWPYCITNLGKPIENRSRKDGAKPSIVNYRGELYLHAAKSWDRDVAGTLFDEGMIDCATRDFLADKSRHPTGIVGKCRAVGSIEPWGCGACGGSTGTWAECGECSGTLNPDDLDLRWWFGGFALILTDVVALEKPVPCKGAFGVWRIPENVQSLCAERQLLRLHRGDTMSAHINTPRWMDVRSTP